MKTKQLSMEDLGVTVEDTIAPVKVAYEDLTKEDLIKLLNDKDKAIENYKIQDEQKDKSFESQLANINETYKQHLDNLKTINTYMSRKLKVIKDIITMEEGEK